MRPSFKEFLNESAAVVPLFVSLPRIKNECKYFLNESGDSPLLRGIRGISEDQATFSPASKNRAPKDSGPGFNFMFNMGYQLAFGYKSIRANCLYATGSQAMAKAYGPTHFIFPAGDFSFTYSPEYADSYEESSSMFSEIAKELGGSVDVYLVQSMFEDFAKKFTVDEFIKGSPEVQEYITDVLEHSVSDEKMEKIDLKTFRAEIVMATKSLFKHNYIESRDLEHAINLKHEIGFFDFPGYWAIPMSKVYEILKQDQTDYGTRYYHSFDTPAELKGDAKGLYEYLLRLIKNA